MAKRRGHGEGSIYQRESDGKWVGSVNLGFENGKRKRKVVYGETRREVSEKLKSVLHDQQQGLPISTARETVGTFLPRWITDKRPTIAPKTFRVYEQMIRLYLVPGLGKIKLAKLTPEDVQRLLNTKVAEGLSPRTITSARAVLRTALNDALAWGLVSRNVAALAKPPKRQQVERRYLTPGEMRAFLDAIIEHRHWALLVTTLGLGLRQGEALGLRWQDIDWDTGAVHVRMQLQRIDGVLQLKELKSKSSRRDLPLPDIVSDALRAQRKCQLEERIAAGPHWINHDLVFANSIGGPFEARNVMRDFARLREQVGMPWLTFHGLRHGFGSLLAAKGVHPRVAMGLMGHSDYRLTMEIYTHVAPELAKEAAEKIDLALGS